MNVLVGKTMHWRWLLVGCTSVQVRNWMQAWKLGEIEIQIWRLLYKPVEDSIEIPKKN